VALSLSVVDVAGLAIGVLLVNQDRLSRQRVFHFLDLDPVRPNLL
jgi:hypothetical protein